MFVPRQINNQLNILSSWDSIKDTKIRIINYIFHNRTSLVLSSYVDKGGGAASKRYTTSNYLWLIPCITIMSQPEDMPPDMPMWPPILPKGGNIGGPTVKRRPFPNAWLIPGLMAHSLYFQMMESEDIPPKIRCKFSTGNQKGWNLKRLHQCISNKWKIRLYMMIFQHVLCLKFNSRFLLY